MGLQSSTELSTVIELSVDASLRTRNTSVFYRDQFAGIGVNKAMGFLL